MIKLMKITTLTAFIMLVGFFWSCNNLSEKELGIEKQGKGTVVFKITDAPFPVDLVEEANITIDWVKILKYPAEEGEEEVAEESEVITMELDEPATFNLLELRNGLSATLAEIEVPAGSYAEIRLHVTDAGILLKDGTDYDLKVPSGNASGLKIKFDTALEVLEGEEAEVLVDFDLSRSFVMQGNPKNIKGFIFKPVVRAVANVVTTTGVVSGIVTDQDETPIAGASLKLMQDEVEVASALTSEEDGFYSIIGVLPGTYMMALEYEGYTKEVPVTVEVGATSVLNFTIEIEALP
jgi:uncharacterized surface anchored protein